MLSHLDADAPLLGEFAVMWRAVCLSVRLSGLPRGCRPAVELVLLQMKKKSGTCWGLEAILLAPGLPLPSDGSGGSPRDVHPKSQGSMAALASPMSWVGGVWVQSQRGPRVSAPSGFTSRLLHDSLLYSQVLRGSGVNPGLLLCCFQRGKPLETLC